jgi:hypothetical protein
MRCSLAQEAAPHDKLADIPAYHCRSRLRIDNSFGLTLGLILHPVNGCSINHQRRSAWEVLLSNSFEIAVKKYGVSPPCNQA